MPLTNTLEERLRQQILNQALFHMLKEKGGNHDMTMEVLSPAGMGGIVVEVSADENRVTLKCVDEEAARAYEESLDSSSH